MNAGFGDDHRFDIQSGHELYVVHGEHVRWIHHGQCESCTDSGEWEYGIFLGHFLRYQAQHGSIYLEELEVNGRNAVLSGEDSRNHVIRNQAQLDEVEAKPPSVFTLVFKRFTQMLRTDQVFADEDFA